MLPSSPETARRLAAAIVYGGLSLEQAADIMGASTGTVSRWKSPESKYGAPEQQLWKLAEAVGLSPDWFYADLDRLSEIVPAGSPRFGERRATPPGGELGSRLGVDPPSRPSPRQRDSDQGTGSAQGEQR